MSGAADFRHPFRFDKTVTVESPYGSTTSGWSTLENGSLARKAAMQMLKGGETVIAQRLTGTQPALIRVLLDAETAQIDPTWRAVQPLDGSERAFGIKSVADMEGKNRVITMLCEAGAADA